jgi:hypothetical protein
MKFIVAFLLGFLLMLTAAPAFSAPDAAVTTAPITAVAEPATDVPTDPKVPADPGAALDMGKGVIADAKAKQYFTMSAGIIWLIMFLFKTGRKTIGFMKKIPKRVLWVVLPILSVGAMLLSKFQGDLSWAAAVGVLTSGPCVAFLNDFVKRGLLNKEPTPMTTGSA